MSDLILFYKGKATVILTEEEIVNNTFDGLVNTGYLMECLSDAMQDLYVFNDFYDPSPLNPAPDRAATIGSRE